MTVNPNWVSKPRCLIISLSEGFRFFHIFIYPRITQIFSKHNIILLFIKNRKFVPFREIRGHSLFGFNIN